MSSESVEVNYAALVIAAVAFLAVPVGMLWLLVKQNHFMVGFPIVAIGFTVFVTTTMMSAKTTGGPQD